MTSILSGRKGLQFPTEFIVEQNEKNLIASIKREFISHAI